MKTKTILSNGRFASLTVFGFLGVFLLVAFYSCTGYMKIDFLKILRIVFDSIFNSSEAQKIHGTQWYVVMEVRLPRILCSAIAGMALSVSGVGFQGVLLNPLADPYTLGISSGAAFGAALSMVFGWSFLGVVTVPVTAFLFAVMTLFLVFRMALHKGKLSPISLVLAGVIISSFFSAGLSFMKYLAGEEVGSIVFWLMGSFASKNWNEVLILSAFTGCGFLTMLFFARDINILSLGEKNASSLGINAPLVRMAVLVSASMMSAAAVSIAGVIGFVGLIIPHLMRFITGPDNRRLLFASAISGAALLATADNLTRAWLPAEVPIGTITALLGGPFFIFIFRRKLKGFK